MSFVLFVFRVTCALTSDVQCTVVRPTSTCDQPALFLILISRGLASEFPTSSIRNFAAAEAIAIGTEYSRADLLTPAAAAKLKGLLKKYLDQRLLFYGQRASVTPADTELLQTELWSALRPAIADVPPPLMGVLVTGMNDLVNTQRSTQAAWLNRIPTAAWALMAVISIGCCSLVGYRSRRRDWLAFAIVPLSASLCFFLIADLDSPQGGVIRVVPNNLMILAQSLSGQ